MAITSTGTFDQKATEPLSPLEQLAQINKKKTKAVSPTLNTAGVSTLGTSNVLAPTRSVEEAAVTPTTPDGAVVGETFEEYKDRTEEDRAPNDPPEAPATIRPQVNYISDDPESPYYWGTLGYPDETWVGLPYDQGYWQVQDDGTEVWVTSRDLTNYAQQLHDLQSAAEMPASPDLIDVTGSTEYQGIQDLIAIWEDPNTAQADKDAAIAAFEQQMGMAPGELSTILGGMLNEINQGVYAQQGMTAADQAAFDRETDLDLQRQRDDFQLMLEALGASGRSVAGFQAMDNFALSMASYEMQRSTLRMNTDLAMRETEYEALRGRWETLYNMGEMSAQQYIENVNNNRVTALQAYSAQINTMLQQNSQTLELYQSDIQAAQAHAQIVYQGIMADIGVSEAILGDMQAHYEMYMAPYYAELEQWALEEQIRQNDAANDAAMYGIAGGLAATGGYIAATGGVVGWAVGGVLALAGGVVALTTAASVVCTELYAQGRMSQDDYTKEYIVLRMTLMFTPEVYVGYRKFADWLVPKMKKQRR